MHRLWLPLLLLLPFPLFAAESETLHRVETYLNSLTTLQSDFTQIAPDGSVETGKFYLQRPGKMRWAYDPPVPVLMISDGRNFTYHDYQLNQITSVPLGDTLAGFLARPKISFDPAVINVVSLTEKDQIIDLDLVQTAKPDEGALTLEFSDAPLQLRKMIVKDASGQTTNVALNNATSGGKIDPDLFVFRDPRIYRKNK